MTRWRTLLPAALALAAAAASASATTLIRMDVQDLVARNQSAVVGHVVDVTSRWNADGTFILSDVRFAPDDTLLGPKAKGEIQFTVMGGTVGDLSTVIVAGPQLEIGGEYVVFLGREDLPGETQAVTVRDLCQGIFDVVPGADGPRAVSQAIHHPLLADEEGVYEAPGGREGLTLDQLSADIRRFAVRR